MTTDPRGMIEEGEELILVTEAGEARASAWRAAMKHQGALATEAVAVCSFLVVGVVAGTEHVPILLPAGVLAVAFLDFLRRRSRKALRRSEAVADELAERAKALRRPPGHPTS